MNWSAMSSPSDSIAQAKLAANSAGIFASANNRYGGTNIHKSTDNGASWTAASIGLPANPLFYCMTLSGNSIFIGVGPTVYVSNNSGASWSSVSSGLPASTGYVGPFNGNSDPIVDALAISGSNIFAGTYGGGIYLSMNNGVSWLPVNSGLHNHETINSLVVKGSNIFAGTTHSGVYISTNNGATWSQVSSGMPAGAQVNCMAVSGDNIFVAVKSGGVYVSSNDGAAWTPVNSGLPLYADIVSMTVIGSNIIALTPDGKVFTCQL
jgi:photosystem II stability/assembly factor-like uncharacterized protein